MTICISLIIRLILLCLAEIAFLTSLFVLFFSRGIFLVGLLERFTKKLLIVFHHLCCQSFPQLVMCILLGLWSLTFIWNKIHQIFPFCSIFSFYVQRYPFLKIFHLHLSFAYTFHFHVLEALSFCIFLKISFRNKNYFHLVLY